MGYEDVTILLVEDNPGDAHLIRGMLEETEYVGAQLKVVATLREAMGAHIDPRAVVLVLLDLNLPDSDGIETLVGIREIFRDSAVIVLTGMEDEKIAVQALREGAQNYHIKGSIDASGLARTIRYSLERHAFVLRLRDAERQLAEKDLRFRKLIEHASDLTLLVGRNGRVAYTSPSVRRMFGFPDELTPDVFSLIHADDVDIARSR
ncbi:MAG TPA: response regulator, partial [Flavobacteriales bacterium]|nr:response regulator [Flavobacteriales bacterium]